MTSHLDRTTLEDALKVTRRILVEAITTSSYGGDLKRNGQEAKNAAIRSSAPIQQLHGVIAEAIYGSLTNTGLIPQVWPPIGRTSPELKITGLLKAKDQDISFTVDRHKAETIQTGVEEGRIDPVGFHATNRALVVGVRSQLSSLAKNFDTLVERAFAETLNLRLRTPNITLGEVYLIPLNEFDDDSLKSNRIGFRNSLVDLGKFARIFNAITDPNYADNPRDLYKYNSTMLLVADFSRDTVKVLWDKNDVSQIFGKDIANAMFPILPCYFVERLTESYLKALKN